MSKLQIILIAVATFVAGGAVSGYAIYALQPDKEVAISTNESQETTAPTDPAPQRSDEISGFDMTPAEMVNALSSMPAGQEFDWRYMNYLQELRLNEIGMSRIATEKATHPELKAVAEEQRKLSDDLNTQLSRWRSLWGYTDH